MGIEDSLEKTPSVSNKGLLEMGRELLEEYKSHLNLSIAKGLISEEPLYPYPFNDNKKDY